jgi:hypothetical protein
LHSYQRCFADCDAAIEEKGVNRNASVEEFEQLLMVGVM